MAEVQKNAEWGKLAGAVATLAAGKDVSIAIATASNAGENNYLNQQARQAFMQVSDNDPADRPINEKDEEIDEQINEKAEADSGLVDGKAEEAATHANELQQVIIDNSELRAALQTLGLCAQEVNAQLYELQCLQGRAQLRNRSDQDFWHDLQYPLGAAGVAAQAKFMDECRTLNQPLNIVGKMCQALCVIEDFADRNPALMTVLQGTIKLNIDALRVATYVTCAAGGAVLGGTMGSIVPGAGTAAGIAVGAAGGMAFAATAEYSVDRAFTAIGSGMGGALDWIKDQAQQAGRTPAERMRFAHAAENGVYGSLAGLGLIAGGRGLKYLSGMGSSGLRMPYTGHMMGRATTVNALNLETRAISGGTKIGIRHEPQFWNKSVKIGENKVYQCNDLIDINRLDPEGNTSLQLMKQGKAPIGPDGKKINLHHMLQTQDGAIAEVTSTFHQQYSKIIHINPKTMRSKIHRPTFDK